MTSWISIPNAPFRVFLAYHSHLPFLKFGFEPRLVPSIPVGGVGAYPYNVRKAAIKIRVEFNKENKSLFSFRHED